MGLAEECLRRGHEVWAIGRHCPPPLSDSVRFVSRDLGVLDDVPGGVRELVDLGQRFDLVVLNAGVLAAIRDLSQTPLEDVQRSMNLNVWANKLLLDALFERAAEVRQVIGISSGAAVSGNRGWNAYALSKATFRMLLQLYAAERAETHFCSFAPGLVDTGMQDYLCGLSVEAIAKYPTVARIQSRRGTPDMPTPAELAPRLLEAFVQVLGTPSGGFVDIRKM